MLDQYSSRKCHQTGNVYLAARQIRNKPPPFHTHAERERERHPHSQSLRTAQCTLCHFLAFTCFQKNIKEEAKPWLVTRQKDAKTSFDSPVIGVTSTRNSQSNDARHAKIVLCSMDAIQQLKVVTKQPVRTTIMH